MQRWCLVERSNYLNFVPNQRLNDLILKRHVRLVTSQLSISDRIQLFGDLVMEYGRMWVQTIFLTMAFPSSKSASQQLPLSSNLPTWSTSAFAGTLTALSGASSVMHPGATAGGQRQIGSGTDRAVVQMIANASLDAVEETMRLNNAMYLKAVDKFNEWTVSAFVTPGNMKFILLHEAKNEDGIRTFFMDVWELYVKTMLNPFHTAHTAIKSSVFDVRVRASARKHL